MKNFRDFGCSNVKKGIFLRGESLDKLSNKDRKMLVNKYHLKVVVDLRTTQEHDDKKDKYIPSVSNIHIPLIKLEANKLLLIANCLDVKMETLLPSIHLQYLQ